MNKTINMIEIVARLQCMQAELVKLNNQVGSLIEEITSSVKNEDVKTMEQLKANKERAPSI